MAVVVLLAALSACTGQPTQPVAGPAVVTYLAADRLPAPDTSGEVLTGGAYALDQHRGEVVVINFWASWCAPCRVEAKGLESVYQSTRTQRVTFLGINTQDQRDAALAFARGRSTYPSLFDPPGRLALSFDVPPNTLPATLIIDRQGRIAVVIRSSVRAEQLAPLVAQIAAEPSEQS
jgi:peroxiredoxin